MKILEDNKTVYKVNIYINDTSSIYDDNPYGSSAIPSATFPSTFKPGKWLMEIYNLAIDYESEKIRKAKQLERSKNNFPLE